MKFKYRSKVVFADRFQASKTRSDAAFVISGNQNGTFSLEIMPRLATVARVAMVGADGSIDWWCAPGQFPCSTGLMMQRAAIFHHAGLPRHANRRGRSSTEDAEDLLQIIGNNFGILNEQLDPKTRVGPGGFSWS